MLGSSEGALLGSVDVLGDKDVDGRSVGTLECEGLLDGMDDGDHEFVGASDVLGEYEGAADGLPVGWAVLSFPPNPLYMSRTSRKLSSLTISPLTPTFR